MSDLPKGWQKRQLGELVDILDARRVPVNAKERESRPGAVPYYGAAGQVGWIDEALFDEPLVLLGEDGVQFFDRHKPKAYGITGPAWVNNHAHVLRARDEVLDRRFLIHYLNWVDYSGLANGTTRLKLTGAAMRRISVRLPPRDEQRWIVDLLEDHLSRLDAADAYVSASERRTSSLTRSILESIVPMDHGDGWRLTTVERAGRLQLGRARHPDWHHGPEMRPYLRVANVFEDRIVTDDVMSMDFTGVFEKYRLHPGDVLLNEGQSPHLLGRPAMYRGNPAEVAFTNSLIRFQASDEVLPAWALLVFRRHMHSGRFRRESRITTNIAHLSMARLKEVEFPIPPLGEQARRVEWAGEALLGLARMRENAAAARKRSARLRRALLEAVFSGRLTGRKVDTEIVEELAGVAS